MTGFQTTLWTLIRGAETGDDASLRAFAQRYRPLVVAYIARRGFEADAEDLAQDVFLRLFRDGVLAKADPSKGRFRALLLAITRHVIAHHLDRLTAQKRDARRTQSLEFFDVDLRAGLDLQPTDEEFDRQWVAHLLDLALERLEREHPRYFAAVQQFLLDGATARQAAEKLGTSPRNVYNHVHRGKQKLIEYLRQQVRDYSLSHPEYVEELAYLSRFFPE